MSAPNMTTCPHCGKEKRVIAAYCPHCRLKDSEEYPNNDPLPEINTVAGVAKYVCTLNDQELWAGDYSTENGYWVIHRGSKHHVYKVNEKSGEYQE